jgi:hypothetical protein
MPRIAPYLAIGAVVAAAVLALVVRDKPRAAPDPAVSAPPPPALDDPHATATPTLPPNHPMIGPNGPLGTVRPNDDAPAITWKVPDGWKVAQNPNAMRLATYRIAPVAGETDEAEVSVSRAGGSTDANIKRWVGQFDEAGKDNRVEKTVRGMKVTIVDVTGTYQGGGMMGGAPATHKGWMLLGAIIETPGSPYFMKMIGPAKTVTAARAAFEKMIEGITPAA